MLTTKPKKKMPLGVKIIALLNLIIGFAFLIGGVELLFSGVSGQSLIFIVASIPSLLVGFSFYKGKQWGWIFAIVAYTVGIITSLIASALGSDAVGGTVGIIIPILIVVYLTMSHVRAYFGRDTVVTEA